MVKYTEHDRSGDAVKGLAKIDEGTDKREVLISDLLKYPTKQMDLLNTAATRTKSSLVDGKTRMPGTEMLENVFVVG